MTALQFVKLQQQVEKLIKPGSDSVRIDVLGADSVKPTISYGSQQPREEGAMVF